MCWKGDEGDSMLWISSQKRVYCSVTKYGTTNTPLNAVLFVQKRKPEIHGFCEQPKPGFRVWQNVRVSPGPKYFKTRVSILISWPD